MPACPSCRGMRLSLDRVAPKSRTPHRLWAATNALYGAVGVAVGVSPLKHHRGLEVWWYSGERVSGPLRGRAVVRGLDDAWLTSCPSGCPGIFATTIRPAGAVQRSGQTAEDVRCMAEACRDAGTAAAGSRLEGGQNPDPASSVRPLVQGARCFTRSSRAADFRQ
jgi:hypothetical protein